MTDPKRQSGEHSEIWLEPIEGQEYSDGRQWCEDDVWGNGVRYVLASEFQSLQERCGELEAIRMDYYHGHAEDKERIAALEGALRTLVQYARWQMNEGADYHPTLPSAVASAEAALAPGGEGLEPGDPCPECGGELFGNEEGDIYCTCKFTVFAKQPHPTEPDRPEGECPHGCRDGKIKSSLSSDSGYWPCPIHGTPQGKKD